jgi:hypothetical protein
MVIDRNPASYATYQNVSRLISKHQVKTTNQILPVLDSSHVIESCILHRLSVLVA